MERVSVDEVENRPHPAGVNSVRRPISAALDTEDVGVVYLELDTGESFGGGLHTHHDQEEVFYILEGEATFEVGREREEHVVAAGEAVRFAPGEFQFGYNASEDTLRGVIIAAPGRVHDWSETEVLQPCAECGEETMHDVEPVGDDGDWQASDVDVRAICRECGASLSTEAL